jgi:thymidylate synthase
MFLHNIKARDIPDAWFQVLYYLLAKGRRYTIERGSYEGQQRIEYDYITIHITYPNTRPLLPDIPPGLPIPVPASEEYLQKYVAYLMTSEKQENEQYTYGEFIEPQLSAIISMLKKTPNTNQACINIGDVNSVTLEHPPCLRLLDFRIQDDKLHLICYFRSWDAWGGLPVNLAGLQILKEVIADEVGVNDGEIIASSKGLHVYGFVEEFVKQRVGRNILKDF